VLWVAWFTLFTVGYKKYYGTQLSRLNEIFMGTTHYDVLFVGSSRTHTSIHPAIVDSITNRSSFNAGVEGGNLLEFLLTFKGYLVHHPPPRLLVLTIDVNSFNLDRKFFNYSEYYNVLENSIVDSFLSANGYSTFVPKHFPPYRLINFDEITKRNVFRGFRGAQELEKDQVSYKGFLSNHYGCVDSAATYPVQTVKINDDAVKYFTEIIDECRTRNIEVMLTYAPEYRFKLQRSFSNPNLTFILIDSLSKKYSVPFYRDDSLPLCNIECFFSNYGHLNRPGAIAYSAILGKRIRDMNVLKELTVIK
jgi:hypothetical protein